MCCKSLIEYASLSYLYSPTRSITVDYILRTKDEILPLAKQLMQQVEFHSHPIRLLGLGVSNQKSATPQEENQWIELELEFEPWPDV